MLTLMNGGGHVVRTAGMLSFGVFTAVLAILAMHTAHVMAVEGQNGSRRATISVGLNGLNSDGLYIPDLYFERWYSEHVRHD